MIPLAVPNLSGNERQYLNHCIDTTFVSSVGEYVTKFEENIAKECDAKFAVATSSGTTAIHLALLAVGVKPGDLVIIPTFTFIATANAVAHCGAEPWLCDIDRDSWTLDVKQLESELENETNIISENVIHKKTGKRIAAIMPVYTLGTIADMDIIQRIGKKYHLPIVADAAAALGATYQNKPIASLADLTTFSFNGNKTITSGGGGMVVGNDEKLLSYIRHISTTARVSVEYDHDVVGYNYRMTNIQAAVGCAQLEQLEQFVERKREIREFYRHHFSDIDGIDMFPNPAWGNSACWFSGIVLQEEGALTVQNACKFLRENGIEGRSFWKPIHLQKPYENCPQAKNLCVADKLWNRILTLPCSTNITDEELETVVIEVKKMLK